MRLTNKYKIEFSLLGDFFRKRKLLITIAFFVFLFNSLLSVISPVFMGKMIDNFRKLTSELNIKSFIVSGKEFLILFCLLVIIQVASAIYLAYLKKEANIHYSNLIFNRILKLDYLQLIHFRTAYLQNRWSADSLNLSRFFGESLFEFIKDILILLFGVLAAFWISPKFSLIVFISIILISVGLATASRYLIKQIKMYLEDMSALSGRVNETISGIVELKIMNFLKIFRNTIKAEIKDTTDKFFYIQLKATFIFSFAGLLVSVSFFAILIYFGYLLTVERMTIGGAVGYIAVIFIIIRSLNGMIRGINELNKILASLKRTGELFSLTSAGTGQVHPVVKKNVAGIETIELKNVDFKYEEKQENILDNFSSTFERGKIYAVKGISGSGKSTMIKILLGIIPLDKGEILINGKNLHEYNLDSFWRRISYMAQDPFLFKGSLLENLKPGGAGNVEKDMLMQVAKKSGLNLVDFPRDMEVEEGGKNVSGGEKRRIALARSFLKEPDVLILDEPTSQVDAAAEKIITDSLVSFARRGKIVIIIAHSPLTIEKADIVIDISNS